MGTTRTNQFLSRSAEILAHLEESGQLKQLQLIESPMGPRISIQGRGEVDCFCSNNYLGLANPPFRDNPPEYLVAPTKGPKIKCSNREILFLQELAEGTGQLPWAGRNKMKIDPDFFPALK